MTIWKFTDKEPVKINDKKFPCGTAARMPETIPEPAGKADTLISDGKLVEAMAIYRSSLARDPSNTDLLQRIEELKSLIRLSGMRRDFILARLERFLELIKRRSSKFLE